MSNETQKLGPWTAGDYTLDGDPDSLYPIYGVLKNGEPAPEIGYAWTRQGAEIMASAPALVNALERIATECGSEVMGCDCAPPGNGEACPKCEIGYVAREAIAKVQGRG